MCGSKQSISFESAKGEISRYICSPEGTRISRLYQSVLLDGHVSGAEQNLSQETWVTC